MWKPGFLRKITDTFEVEEFEDDFVDEEEYARLAKQESEQQRMGERISLKDDKSTSLSPTSVTPPQPVIKELHVDVYQTPDAIVVRTMVPGILPANMDIALTREMITISGAREEMKEVTEDNYFMRELAWGQFSRTITLPAEVEVDAADAEEQHGVLTIRLPKVDKDREAKVRIKSK